MRGEHTGLTANSQGRREALLLVLGQLLDWQGWDTEEAEFTSRFNH